MAWQLPPLNPLKAFEAAGRNLSFKRAAAELHVTQAAVSRQVRLLEEMLGVKLFQRHHRAVALTAEGREFLGEASAAFNQLSSATARAESVEEEGDPAPPGLSDGLDALARAVPNAIPRSLSEH